MLWRISEQVQLLNDQIDHCQALLDLIPGMENDPNVDFSVVDDGVRYCLLGCYRRMYERAKKADIDGIKGEFGIDNIDNDDYAHLFGGTDWGTLRDREHYLRAHIRELELKRGDACVDDSGDLGG